MSPFVTDPIDLDAFHRYIWKKANRLGKVTFLRTDLADELALSKFTISRIMAKMMAEQRAFKIGHRGRGRNGDTYQIVDPDVWAHKHAS